MTVTVATSHTCAFDTYQAPNPRLVGARLTVKQYHNMIRSAILTENDPVELLEGVLVEKIPHNPPHDATVTRLHRIIGKLLNEEWVVPT